MGTPPFDTLPDKQLPTKDITNVRTSPYLRRYGKKIARDLALSARLVHGKYTKVFRPDGTAGRCTTCTDSITGSIVLHHCPVCHGAGELSGFKYLGETWAVPEVSPKIISSTEMGTGEDHGVRDNLYIYDFQILHDRDLLWVVDLDLIYKVVDVEPQLGAVQGIVVSQFLQCCRLLQSNPEYIAIHAHG